MQLPFPSQCRQCPYTFPGYIKLEAISLFPVHIAYLMFISDKRKHKNMKEMLVKNP